MVNFYTALMAEPVAQRLLFSVAMKWEKGGSGIGYAVVQCFCIDIGRQRRMRSGLEGIYSDEAAEQPFMQI